MFLNSLQLFLSMVLLILLLVGIGLVMLYSAGYATAANKKAMNYDPYFFVRKQGFYAVVGLIAMYVASRFNYHNFKWIMPMLTTVSMILMVLTPFIGTKVKGARRWLWGFQPSELAKFALIIFFAVMMTKMGRKKMKTFTGGFMFYMFSLGVVVVTLVLQKHLSAIVIMSVTAGIMMFIGGTRVTYLVSWVLTGVVGGVGYILKNPYAMERVRVWLDPFSDFRGAGWQALITTFLSFDHFPYRVRYFHPFSGLL